VTSDRLYWVGAVLLIVTINVALHVPWSDAPFRGDDAYILRNLESSDLERRAWAWTVTHPSPSSGAYVPWYSGYSFRRHHVRLVPSMVAAIHTDVFGRTPRSFHLLAIALHAVSCLLLLQLLLRLRLDRATSTLAAALFAAHPAATHVTTALSTFPIVVAGVGVLLSALLYLRHLRDPTRSSLGALFVSTLGALCTYEAIVLLPVFVCAVDVYLERRHVVDRAGGWPLRVGMLACLATYMIGRWVWGAEDFTLGDELPLHLIVPTLSGDLAGYWTKAFGIASISLHRKLVTSTDAWLAALVWLPMSATAMVVFFRRRQHVALLGLSWFFVFIAPPVLARATVSVLNLPGFRQVYVPAIGIGIVIAVCVSLSSPRARRVVAPAALIAMIGCNVWWGATWGKRISSMSRLQSMVVKALEPQAPSGPVVWLGAPRLGFPYSVVYDWPGRTEIAAVPPVRSGGRLASGLSSTTMVCRTGERTLVARSNEPFEIGGPADEASRGRLNRLRFKRPDGAIFADGDVHDLGAYIEQGEARVRALDVRGDEVFGLAFELPVPIDALSFLWIERVSPGRDGLEIRAFEPPPCPLDTSLRSPRADMAWATRHPYLR